MFTVKKLLTLHWQYCLQYRHHRANHTLCKINAGKRLIDLKCPWLASFEINMIPIVQTKCYIAVLLNLKHHDVATHSMNSPGRQENGIAGLWNKIGEMVCNCTICNCLTQTFSCGIWFQACIDAAFIPCF